MYDFVMEHSFLTGMLLAATYYFFKSFLPMLINKKDSDADWEEIKKDRNAEN